MSVALESRNVAAQLDAASRRRPVWVRVGALLDGQRREALPNAHLVYDAEGIRHVGGADDPPPSGKIAPGQKTPDVELPEYTVLPGLVEAHAHLFLDGAPMDFEQRKHYLKQPGEWMLERARRRLERIVRCGVMTIRDAGDKHGVGLKLRDEYRARTPGADLRPCLDSPGKAIHHKGRYGSFVGGALEEYPDPEACVEARCAEGADRIKLIATGIINFKKGAVTAPPQMAAEEVAALVEAAKRRGRQSFAHASGAPGVGNAIEGGVATVEHGFFVTPEQLARMRDRGVAWVPTFVPVQVQIDRASEMGWDEPIVAGLKRIIEGHAESLRRAAGMGLIVLAGSDAGSCGVPHGLGLLTELELMERAGMSAAAIVTAATGASAAFLKFAEPVGYLADGYRARMIFTRFSPLQGLSNLRREKIIVFDGQAVESGARIEPEGL